LLLAAVVATMSVSTVEAAEDPPFCRVRNATQRSVGASLHQLLPATQAGDRLVVEGTCLAAVTISHDLVIVGATDNATLTGENRQTLEIARGATVRLRRLTITGGRDSWFGDGGGILNEGTLTIVDSRIVDNRAWSFGGGIYNGGRLTLVDSVVSENRSVHGGGIYSDGPELTLRRTKVARNSDAIEGGGGVGAGIYVARGTVTLYDSMIRGNRTSYNAGGIAAVGGSLSLYRTTVTRNRAEEFGGGIWKTFEGSLTLDAASSVTGNTPDDCHGTRAC
jgi:hypothetical protein